MKTKCFLFVMIGLGVLTPGVGLAAESSSPLSARVPRETHTTSARSADLLRGNTVQMERSIAKSSQPGPIHTQTKHPTRNELHQHGPNKAATAANSGRMMNKTVNHFEPPAKSPIVGGTTALGPEMCRSRSANLAVLGGLNYASAKHSTAALDGAAMRRSP
ncbi:MAG TPA: hypothetical protein VGR14_04770 [Verrucomicrobiae bacterium]|jgi:hypothetical protein|nr:hypothetical protein [Verrucomicrobiae bacterium]